MKYEERERQVERFRDPNGAQYLVATDAAGEGINLQFCWLMVNYDIPWNPARLEQRMTDSPLQTETHGGSSESGCRRNARGKGVEGAAGQIGTDAPGIE